jgi:hypothetical protein
MITGSALPEAGIGQSAAAQLLDAPAVSVGEVAGATAPGVAAPSVGSQVLNAPAVGAGGPLASEAGFVPGSFELGTSGYGGTATSGLNAAGAEVGAGGVAGPSKGIIGNSLDWLNANPGMRQLVGTGVQFLSGMGKNASDKEIMERKAALELQNKESFLGNLQSRSLNQNPLGIAPGGGRVLRRLDGTPVYSSSGIISNALHRAA